MTEQTTTDEGTDPRCRAGSATDNRCPRPATRTAWGDDGPPEICVFHSRLWEINDDLGQYEAAQEMLGLWDQQARMLSCPSLEAAIESAKAEVDREVARLRREQAELEERERAGS